MAPANTYSERQSCVSSLSLPVPSEMILGFNEILPSLYSFFPVKDLHWFPPVRNELDEDTLQSLCFPVILCQAQSAETFLNERRAIPVPAGSVIRTCTRYFCVSPTREALGLLQLARESQGTE